MATLPYQERGVNTAAALSSSQGERLPLLDHNRKTPATSPSSSTVSGFNEIRDNRSMVSCCWYRCSSNDKNSSLEYIQLYPCRHCFCPRCYHEVSVLGETSHSHCASCSQSITSSKYLRVDSETGGVVERGQELQHPGLLSRVLWFFWKQLRAIIAWVLRSIQNPRTLLFRLTPEHNPLPWVFVNGFVVLYSSYLLLLVLHYEVSGRKERKSALREADQSYLVYDTATTVLWVIETTLGATTVFRRDHWVFSKCLRIVHLMIALAFLSDSLETLRKWKWKQEDIEVDALWVLGDLAAYVLAFVETLVLCWWQRRERRNNPQQPLVEIHHDPLLASLLPFYDSIERKCFARTSGGAARSLEVQDWTTLFEAFCPNGVG